MDWNGRNSNGAVAHVNNQQYLPQSTSSTVPTMTSHMAYVQSPYSSAQTLVTSNRNPILTGLLGAGCSEEILKIQQALEKIPAQQNMHVSPGQYNSSYNPLHKTSNGTNYQSSPNVVISNYQTQVYPNSVLQTFQQAQPLPVVQQQAQPLPVVQQQAPAASSRLAHSGQIQELLQINQRGVYRNSRGGRLQISNSYAAKKSSQKAQRVYQPIVEQPNTVNSVRNGSSASDVASHKILNNKMGPVSTANYQNGQNSHNLMGSHYQTISHTNALQPQQGMNDYAQSPQRQTMPNVHGAFANNSCNVLPSTTVGQTQLFYSQSNTNASNVYNVSVNHSLSNPHQNFVAQNVQQPIQSSYTLPQVQPSVAVPPPAYNGNVQQDQRKHLQEILALLQVYRNVKAKYLLLNRENNLVRQNLSTLQYNPGSYAVRPPLLSSIPNMTVPTNDTMGEQVVSQNVTVQSRPPSNTTHVVQTPVLYDSSLNVPFQNIPQPSNAFSSHVYATNNSNVLNQTNNTGFESGQMNPGTRANSAGQVVSSETLRVLDPQATSMVSMQINNQYFSNGNSSSGNLLQHGQHRTSAQSFVQTNTASSESCNPVFTTNTGNFYANTPLTSSSREAINVTLPLWKSLPQSSAQNKSGYLEQKHMDDDGHHLVAEIASRSIYESTAVTLTSKSEHSGPNLSKGIELQVAIVNPLVQIKEMVTETNQHPKVVPEGKDVANGDANGFKDCFDRKILALESVNTAATMKNLDAIPPTSNIVSPPLYRDEVSPNSNIDQNSTENVEIVDNLHISGICTLVEGNSFYNSSVAMMFEGSLQTQLGPQLAKMDLKDHPTPQNSQEGINIHGASQATSSISPTTEMVAVKTEPQGDVEPPVIIEDNPQGADIYSLDIQPEQNLSPSNAFDLESNAASDQLSELLTEFPFGIKNYISEKKLKSAEVSLKKLAETHAILKTSVPFSCDRERGGSIEDTHRGGAMNTSTKVTDSLKTEITDQQSAGVRVPTPELPTDEGTSVQSDEDVFEVSDSPDGNMHFTLLDQDEIAKLFPEDSAKPTVDSEESVESLAKESAALIVDVAVKSIKEKPNDKTASDTDPQFCCMLTWSGYKNGNAPKCDCKLSELVTEDLTSNISQPTAVNKTEPSTAILKPSRDFLYSSTDCLKPSPDLCNTEFDILPPVIKRPKLNPTDISSECKPALRINCSPQEKIKPKPYLSTKHLKDELQKELRKNDTLTNEKILQSKSNLKVPDSRKTRDPSLGHKPKVDSSQKLEKLIIKTDFLKNKHFLKMKKKYKERKTSRGEKGAHSVEKINKNTEVGESGKAPEMDRVIGGKANNEKCKPPAGTAPQFEKTTNKLKSSSSSDKSHSYTKDLSSGKRRGRVKRQPESHFEKVKKVPTVQEYLERKRELCNQRSGPTVDQKDEPAEVRHKVVEKPSIERLAKVFRPLCPAKLNVKTKNIESEAIKQTRKHKPTVGGEYEFLHKKYRGPSSSHRKGSLVSKDLEQKSTSYKNKIYLSPCDGSRRASYDGVSLTKLQIRCSPEKPEYYERRKSDDGSGYSKPSKSGTKNGEAPKMLEFKLCPEFVPRSPSTQERKGEPKAAKEKSVIEGIKSKKEAWCTGGPLKKTRMDSISEDQGCRSPSLSTSSLKSKSSSRPLQDSQTTFNVFKQMYHEQRSKSLDSSL